MRESLGYEKTRVQKGFELSKNQLSKQITEIFVKQYGKRVGSSMLRKSFLSYLYKDDVKWKMKMKIAALMNHSVDVGQINYAKHLKKLNFKNYIKTNR